VADGVGVAAGVDVAGTLVRDGVAVGDGLTVRCGAGVCVADLVGLARGVGRGLAGDLGGLGVGEASGCTGAGVWLLDLTWPG
jgi:hypothetical protein